MRSRVADETRRDQQQRAAGMSAADRLATALAMGERAISDYMKNFRVSRATAVRILRRAGQAGRRYSACLDEDAHGGSDRGGR
jgi:hypothetical protein